jgi:hypothetical protein
MRLLNSFMPGMPKSLAERVREAEKRLNANLTLLIWGPGRKSKKRHWYEKRLRVIEFLRAQDQRYTVATSEEVFDELDENIDVESGKRELLHADLADLIFVLVLGPPKKQPGVYRELDLISDRRKLRDKTWIFLPENLEHRERFSAGSLKNFRRSHIVSLPWKVIEECQEIRRVCREKAEEEIQQKLLDSLHAAVE